ncbi:hypothetical protein BDA99DRAFT_426796, partial [Phascolomyces articulosus]
FETLTFNEIDIISTTLAKEWAPELTHVSCVAYLLDNPVLSLLTILALLKLQRVVFPISTRNSASAIKHLLANTQTGYLVTSEKYHVMAQTCCQSIQEVENNDSTIKSSTYDHVDDCSIFHYQRQEKTTTMKRQQHEETILIIHTSGTTSFPKPIYHTNRLLLFTVLDLLGSHFRNASLPLSMKDVVMLTFPLFHGHGIMSLFMILSMGATAVMFYRLPPLPRDTLYVIERLGVTAITVPPIQLEELATYVKNQEKNENEQQVRYCTYSGAPLNLAVGDYLHSKGLNVRNGYGSSETGFVGGPDLSRDNKQWYHMKTLTSPTSPYIYWEPINKSGESPIKKNDSSSVYQLTFTANYPALGKNVINRLDGGYATGDLFVQDPPHSGIWRHVGRVDDTLVMKNGEKTNPIPMENEINQLDIVKNCMVIGENRECTAVLIELDTNQINKFSPTEIVSKVYDGVKQANKMAPSHSTLMIPHMVYILPLDKKLVTTFKGTLTRQKTIDFFQKEIDQMYDTFLQGTATSSSSSMENHELSSMKSEQDIQTFLYQAASQVLHPINQTIDPTVPLFDYGLDSLLAIQLRNKISIRFKSVLSVTNFCFEYPTIESMIQVLTPAHILGSSFSSMENHTSKVESSSSLLLEESKKRQEKHYQETQSILYGYFARIENDFPTKASNSHHPTQEQTVLLTGATGSLGSFLLDSMMHSRHIRKIYCLVRCGNGDGNDDQQSKLKKRIAQAFQDRHLSPPDFNDIFHNKVHVLPITNHLDASFLGLGASMYYQLQQEVTMIQCCGWLLDFNHTIQHYDRACIRGLYNLIQFAYRGPTKPPIHVHVISSISATASLPQFLQKEDYIIPERPSPQDPHVALPMGYAQSKYIVEQMFSYLAEHKNMPCFVERMGQIMGDTHHGVWNASEHYPLMMMGGAVMNKMPDQSFRIPHVDWLPVDSAATAILEIMLHYAISPLNDYFTKASCISREQQQRRRCPTFHHIINPNRITWLEMLQMMTDCGLEFDIVQTDQWVDELRKQEDNPAYRLLSYFENNWATNVSSTTGENYYHRMPLWDTEETVQIAPSLAMAPVLDVSLFKKCLLSWRQLGF